MSARIELYRFLATNSKLGNDHVAIVAVHDQAGDLVVFYSDGITEAGVLNENEFGESRLAEVVAASFRKPLSEIQGEILESTRKWSGGEQEDDMTLLLVRVVGSDADSPRPVTEGT